MVLVLLCTGYNSTDAFNDHRLVEMARLVSCGLPTDQTSSHDDCSLPVLNTAVCDAETSLATDDIASVDITAPAEDRSTLTDLKLAVSVPVSLAAGLSVTKTVSEPEPTLPKFEAPINNSQSNAPPGVNPQALNALEMLLGMWSY